MPLHYVQQNFWKAHSLNRYIATHQGNLLRLPSLSIKSWNNPRWSKPSSFSLSGWHVLHRTKGAHEMLSSHRVPARTARQRNYPRRMCHMSQSHAVLHQEKQLLSVYSGIFNSNFIYIASVNNPHHRAWVWGCRLAWSRLGDKEANSPIGLSWPRSKSGQPHQP